jgi:hypothetical protein
MGIVVPLLLTLGLASCTTSTSNDGGAPLVPVAGCYRFTGAGGGTDVFFNGALGIDNVLLYNSTDGQCYSLGARATGVYATTASDADNQCGLLGKLPHYFNADLNNTGYGGLTNIWLCGSFSAP